MKKNNSVASRVGFASVALIFAFCVIFSGCNVNNNAKSGNLLRLHVRANSNQPDDQAVKMIVKEAVVNYLEPLLSSADDMETAIKLVGQKIDELEKLCDRTLKENGKTYSSEVVVHSEYFPTRAYENVVVEAGVYDAIIVRLGEGAGDNWWCVVYPPLCFVKSSEEGVHYKSRIAELWRRFISSRK
ncbi:MAG: stage II sporulation protein R [Candidatus Neoclostridium sp.]